MKIKAEQLSRQLKGELPGVIWLAGDEPLLIQESADSVRAACRQQGFSEREIFNVDRSFNWETFLQAAGNLSLFAERKLIELRLQSAKLDDAAKKALQQYVGEPSPDLLILISSPKLEGATLNTKWFKAIESDNALVQIWPINRDGLASWLDQRLRKEKISADHEALQLLVDRVEGNLLAAMQEIEKLKLLADNDGGDIKLDASTVLQVVADNSRYTVYQLVDAALDGDIARAQKILVGLQAEGLFPLVVLGAITRECRSLLLMLEKKAAGQGVNAIIQSSRVFWNRKNTVTRALQRLEVEQIWRLLEHARRIDQIIKGMRRGNSWDELGILLSDLAGKRLPLSAPQQAGL